MTGRPSGDADVGAAERAAWIARHAGRRDTLLVGCPGVETLRALARAGGRVTAVDQSHDAVERARAAVAAERFEVTVEHLSMSEWPFDDGSFDRVILDRTLEHQLVPEHMLEQARRVLRDDGTLIVAARYGVHRHGDHADALYLERLGALLADAFSLVSAALVSAHVLVAARLGASPPDHAALLRIAEQRLGEVDIELLRADEAAVTERERAEKLQASLEMMRSSRGWRLAKALRDGTRSPRAVGRLPRLIAEAIKRES